MKTNFLVSFAEAFIYKIPKCIDNIVIKDNKLHITTYENTFIFLLSFLEKHITMQYEVLIDLTALHYLTEGKSKYHLYYFLRSVFFNSIVVIKFFKIDELMPITSSSGIYKGAGWLEREVWDMFGLVFYGHSDLRRILTDYGFQGFPLRKDFPLTGFLEVRYDDESKRVIYDLLELTQEFRFFDFQSPWQNFEFIK